MKTTSYFLRSISLFLYFSISAHAESGYHFNYSEKCPVKKLENKSWHSADASELELIDLDIQTAKNSATQSITKVGDTWYMAPSSCFEKSILEQEPVKTETLTNPKNITSEYMHQAAPSTLEISPQFSYAALTFNVKNSLIKEITSKGYSTSLTAEYGISESLTLGAQLAYVNSTLETSPSSSVSFTHKGLSDPKLFINGMDSSDHGNLRYGVGLSFPIETSTVGSNGSTNGSSGGVALLPMIGYELILGQSIIGAQAAFSLKGTRTIKSISTEYKVTGGSEFDSSLFYEYHIAPSIIGLAAAYSFGASTKTESNGTTVNNNDKSIAYGASLYSRLAISETLDLVPSLTYGIYNALSGLSASDNLSINVWGLGLKARLKF